MNRELLSRAIAGAKGATRFLLLNVNRELLDRAIEGAKGAITLSLLKRLLLYTACFLALYVVVGVSAYLIFNDNLPDIDAWSFRPKRVTNVYSADGRHLQDFLEENREILTHEEIPASMQDALLAAEDRRFFAHWGIDIYRIPGALLANLKDRRLVGQGASTLTQQLARSIFAEVGTQRSSASFADAAATYARKIREQITAVLIERLYTKPEIMTMYLNTVYFGHGAYGIKSAARLYFDSEVDQLALEESALLVGLLPRPNSYSPLRHPERARKQRNLVLYSMADNGAITSAERDSLRNEPIDARRGSHEETYGIAPYFVEHVRQQMQREFGMATYREGFVVLQQIAEKHFDTEIGKVQEKVDKYLKAVGASQSARDSAVVQAAFVAMDPATGHILAMIGGRDFSRSKFNRATQAKRQPGSAFKPFVYTAAIDNNRFAVDVLDDNAFTLWDHRREQFWDPENYDKKFKGPMTLREGLKQSRNLISIKLADELGPSLIRSYARNMGISTPIQAIPSIGVGTSEVLLLDLVAAYAVFPNKGIYVEPMSISRLERKDGDVFFTRESGRKQEVLRPAVAVIVADMLRSAVDEVGGTGRGIRTKYDFRSQAAGKTGTTNDYTDAWFIGFTPHLVAGVWVGIDDPSLRLWPRQAGSAAALPLWAEFMKEVYASVEPYRSLRNRRFEYPENLVVRHAVCNDSYKIATRFCPDQREELFIAGGVLPSTCPLHGRPQEQAPGRIQRF
ncbi:MAG: PBP1A family penicillin-binding protein [Candidatus Latescibacteria bacterium]|nr:PBP1A family penicillin-binding protein [Candidatus Latescibacterota bacterium]